jgi:hypothetical protein
MVGIQLNTEVAWSSYIKFEGYKFNNSGVSYSDLNQSFTLAKDWSATWNSFYSQNGLRKQPSNHLTICHLA